MATRWPCSISRLTRTSGILTNAASALRSTHRLSRVFGPQATRTQPYGHGLPYNLRSFSSTQTLGLAKPTAALWHPRWINNRQGNRAPNKEDTDDIEPEEKGDQGVNHESASVLLNPSDDDGHQTPPASSSSGSSSSGDNSDSSSSSSPPGSDPPSASDPPTPTSALTKQSVPE
ncbi:hypothetical protein FRC09_019105, partial [Ceratobasidium sp. 395]